MKKILSLFCVSVLILSLIVVLVACDDATDGIQFEQIDDFLVAGELSQDVDDQKALFVPMMTKDMYVVDFACNDNTYLPQKLYCPGSIGMFWDEDFAPLQAPYICTNGKSINLYYCGSVINLNQKIVYGDIVNPLNVYVPSKHYQEFVDAWDSSSDGKSVSSDCIHRANVVYKLNSYSMPEYYYVDYVENGGKIKNLPPDPVRENYVFHGWYYYVLNKKGTYDLKKLKKGKTVKWDEDSPEPFELVIFARWENTARSKSYNRQEFYRNWSWLFDIFI